MVSVCGPSWLYPPDRPVSASPEAGITGVCYHRWACSWSYCGLKNHFRNSNIEKGKEGKKGDRVRGREGEPLLDAVMNDIL